MIRLFVVAFCFVLSGLPALAQRIFPLGAGLFVGAKAGIINASIPEGAKTAINFNSLPDVGVMVYMPFSRLRPLGATFDVGYITYSYGTKVLERFDNANNVKIPELLGYEEFSFILAGANICYGPLTLGVGVGIPKSGKSSRDTVTLSPGSAQVSLIEKSDLQDLLVDPLIEGRIGVMVPLVFKRLGRLNLTVQGTYCFTKMYYSLDDCFLNRDIQGNALGYDFIPKGAALTVGLNFLFSLQKM